MKSLVLLVVLREHHSQLQGRKKRLSLFDDKLAASLDMAKLSDHGAAVVITPVLQNLGHDPAEYKVGYSTIRHEQINIDRPLQKA